MFAIILSLVVDPLAMKSLTPLDARNLNGKVVTVSFVVGRPTFACKGITTAGPAESPDQIERVVILKGERFDVRPGETLTVTGTMRLLTHPGRG